MEANRRHTTTGFENSKSYFQAAFDLVELVVDGDPDALKGPGRHVDARARIHAHVQRALPAEAETAVGSVELDAGKTEVEEDEVSAIEAGLPRQLVHLAEAAMDDDRRGPELIEGGAGGGDSGGIAVDPEQPAARRDPLQDPAGVARLPYGAVDRDRPRLGLEQLHYLL